MGLPIPPQLNASEYIVYIKDLQKRHQESIGEPKQKYIICKPITLIQVILNVEVNHNRQNNRVDQLRQDRFESEIGLVFGLSELSLESCEESHHLLHDDVDDRNGDGDDEGQEIILRLFLLLD